MLLAERLRTQDEKDVVKEEIETRLKVRIGVNHLYDRIEPFLESQLAFDSSDQHENSVINKIAPTRSFLRLVTLVSRCIEQNEPVLLVGGT
jgi:midasin